jgi:ABC-type glycerol-3-phosphate transport system substrate-binding protein
MNRKAATYAEWGYLSIAAKTADVDRAWELVRFLAGSDGDAQALRDGVAGPIQKGSEPRFMTGSGASKNKAAAIQAAQQPIAIQPLHDAWDQIRSLQDFYLSPVWAGNEKAVYATRALRQVVDGVLAGLETPKQPAVGNSGGDAGAAGAGGDSGG